MSCLGFELQGGIVKVLDNVQLFGPRSTLDMSDSQEDDVCERVQGRLRNHAVAARRGVRAVVLEVDGDVEERVVLRAGRLKRRERGEQVRGFIGRHQSRE